jgi:hypothetical protein
MNEPTDIWIDARVANTLPVHKDEELAERGVDQAHYIHEAKVKQLLRQAGPPGEAVIQIAALVEQVGDVREDRLVVLTNLGRILERKALDWVDIDLPDLET